MHMNQIYCYDGEATQENGGGLITFGLPDGSTIAELTVEDLVTGQRASVCLDFRALQTLVIQGAAALQGM